MGQARDLPRSARFPGPGPSFFAGLPRDTADPGDRHTRRVPCPWRCTTWNELEPLTRWQRWPMSGRRARIHSYEALSVSAGPYYATLLFNADAIIGEVVSNVLLPADHALSPGQEHRLETLGWTQPDDEFGPSFHRTWSTGGGLGNHRPRPARGLRLRGPTRGGRPGQLLEELLVRGAGRGDTPAGAPRTGKLPRVRETGVLRPRSPDCPRTGTRYLHLTCRSGV